MFLSCGFSADGRVCAGVSDALARGWLRRTSAHLPLSGNHVPRLGIRVDHKRLRATAATSGLRRGVARSASRCLCWAAQRGIFCVSFCASVNGRTVARCIAPRKCSLRTDDMPRVHCTFRIPGVYPGNADRFAQRAIRAGVDPHSAASLRGAAGARPADRGTSGSGYTDNPGRGAGVTAGAAASRGRPARGGWREPSTATRNGGLALGTMGPQRAPCHPATILDTARCYAP